MQTQIDIRTAWNKVVDHVKLKVMHRTLWEALENAVPVTIDEGQFIVGFAPGSFHLSGNMTTSEHKMAIENAIRQFTGQPLTLRIIEGTSLQDWAHAKAKDQRMAALRDAAYQKQQQEKATAKSWEGLLEYVSRRYANTPLRTLPQAKAKYIEEVVRTISETMDELMPDSDDADDDADELAERSLARVLEKVATLTEVPSAIIALELRRFRRK
ncbi:MAG: hypothetical protein QME62_02370 [Armatimonadota bacterium]|nr:hypothetical protein [Armatimonadota bacterium]